MAFSQFARPINADGGRSKMSESLPIPVRQLPFERADVRRRSLHSRKAGPALVVFELQRIVALVDRGATLPERAGWRVAAVEGQWSEQGIAPQRPGRQRDARDTYQIVRSGQAADAGEVHHAGAAWIACHDRALEVERRRPHGAAATVGNLR